MPPLNIPARECLLPPEGGACASPVWHKAAAEVQTDVPLPAFVSCTFLTQMARSLQPAPVRMSGERWCKHMVAACLVLLYEPEAVEEHPALETLLQPFNREELAGTRDQIGRAYSAFGRSAG